MIHPTLFTTADNMLLLLRKDALALKRKPQAILWLHNGKYGFIPVNIIREEIDHSNKNAQMCYGSATRLIFYWAEAVEIPSSTGQAMKLCNGH